MEELQVGDLFLDNNVISNHPELGMVLGKEPDGAYTYIWFHSPDNIYKMDTKHYKYLEYWRRRLLHYMKENNL